MAETLELFGLTLNQTRLLFSIDKYLVESDIEGSKADKKKLKREWLREWESAILAYLKSIDPTVHYLYGLYDIHKQVKAEKDNMDTMTWYYMIVLEASIFSAYTPLDEDIKKYKTLRFSNQIETLKNLVKVDGYIDPDYVEEMYSEYIQNTKKLRGKGTKTIAAIFSAVAVAAAAAALCAVFAGPIAVALVGGQFAGLYGAALTSASLALLGGGALAAGGAGMAGGFAVIVGGGAVLGLAAGGVTGGVASNALLSSPEYVISECSKFAAAFKKIIIVTESNSKAKAILSEYEKSIVAIEEHVQVLVEKKEKKTEIKKLQLSIDYMKKTYANCADMINKVGEA